MASEMVVTCAFYGFLNCTTRVELEVDREKLAIGQVFAFRGDRYLILSLGEANGTYLANMVLEQLYHVRTRPRPRSPHLGMPSGEAHGSGHPTQASAVQALLAVTEDTVRQLQQEREDALTRCDRAIEQLDRLLQGEVHHRATAMDATPTAAMGSEAHTRAGVEQGRQQGNGHKPAVPRLKGVVVAEPADVQALMELGKLYKHQGLDDHAIRAYRQALTIRPDDVDAMEQLAVLLEKLNRLHEASPLWDRLLGRRGDLSHSHGDVSSRPSFGCAALTAVVPAILRKLKPWPLKLFCRTLSAPER